MRQLFTYIVILSLITACGIKRNLELPCQVKYHQKDNTQSTDAQANNQPPTPPANNKPCPKAPTSSDGQPLPTSDTSGTVQKQ